MPRYDYKCEETGDVVEKEYSMKDDIPKEIEIDGKKYIKQFPLAAIAIPEHMKATNGVNKKLNFDKPITGKHFW
jgi:hypothetical protein